MKEDIAELEIIIKTMKDVLQEEIKDTTEDVYTIDGRQFRALENLLTEYKKLKQENEEWQRAYQEEKDKQFELLRENKEMEEENKELIRQYEYQGAKMINEYMSFKNVKKLFIPKSKIEEQIKWLDNDIKNTKNKLEEGKRPYPNYIGEHRRLRMKAFITKSKEIKQRLQDLLRKE